MTPIDRSITTIAQDQVVKCLVTSGPTDAEYKWQLASGTEISGETAEYSIAKETVSANQCYAKLTIKSAVVAAMTSPQAYTCLVRECGTCNWEYSAALTVTPIGNLSLDTYIQYSYLTNIRGICLYVTKTNYRKFLHYFSRIFEPYGAHYFKTG